MWGRKFISVETAYARKNFWSRVQNTALAVAAIDFVFVQNGPVLVVSVMVWVSVDKTRKLYHRLFWSQAEMLHTSTASGDPAIYRFMSRRDQQILAKKSFDKFSQRGR